MKIDGDWLGGLEMHPCRICDKRFINKRALDTHTSMKHRPMSDPLNRIPVPPPMADTMEFLRTAGVRALERTIVPVKSKGNPGIGLLSGFNGQPCPYCRRPMRRGGRHTPTRDHVRPRRTGATLANGNLLVVCAPCNNDKDDMLLEEFALYLKGINDPRYRHVAKVLAVASDIERVQIGNAVVVFDDDDEEAPEVIGKAIPKTVPIEYPNDMKAQEAFEFVYRNRLHLLRIRP